MLFTAAKLTVFTRFIDSFSTHVEKPSRTEKKTTAVKHQLDKISDPYKVARRNLWRVLLLPEKVVTNIIKENKKQKRKQKRHKQNENEYTLRVA